MDFARFSLAELAAQSSWVHLEMDGEPLWRDDAKREGPCRVLVRSAAHKDVAAALRRIERAGVGLALRNPRTGLKDESPVLAHYQSEMNDADEALMVAAIEAWENIEAGGKPMEFTRDNVLGLFGPGAYFYSQVRAAIEDNRRFFTDAEPISSPTRRKKAG